MQAEVKKERIISIDFLRGLTVAFMIFVNSPGNWDYVHPWFAHATWNGCTPTDLIFPFFLFIVGLSISFSFSKLSEQQKKRMLLLKIFKRAVLLFLIGLLLNGFPYYHLETLRIPGVLQRIAIVFLICSVLYLYTNWLFQLVIILSLLLGYWMLLTCVEVPGELVTGLEPTNNLAAWVDHCLLKEHVWAKSKPWDPEGILSTLPAIASGLIGTLAGSKIKHVSNKNFLIIYFVMIGNLLLLLGVSWNIVFPINKNLWTSSYVLFTSGIALHALALSYWLMDMKGYRKFTKPLLAFGSNAISAYILSELIEACFNLIMVSKDISVKMWVFENVYASWLGPVAASHVMAMSFVLLIYIPIYWMYNKRIIVKI